MGKEKKSIRDKAQINVIPSSKDLSHVAKLILPDEEPSKRFSVDCPLSWHKKLKKLANLSGTSIAHVVRIGLDNAYGLSEEEQKKN